MARFDTNQIEQEKYQRKNVKSVNSAEALQQRAEERKRLDAEIEEERKKKVKERADELAAKKEKTRRESEMRGTVKPSRKGFFSWFF